MNMFWPETGDVVDFKRDKQRLMEIARLIEGWKAQRDKFASATYAGDLTTIQYIVYSSHIDALERILNE